MHFPDSNRHSVEGDKRDDLSGNAWFKNTQKLAGDKKFIHAQAEKACKRPRPCIPPDTYDTRAVKVRARRVEGTQGRRGSAWGGGLRGSMSVVHAVEGFVPCSAPCQPVVEQIQRAGQSCPLTLELCVETGHNNVTCADYGCYAQWSATKVAIL
jgi:hypothetical protein